MKIEKRSVQLVSVFWHGKEKLLNCQVQPLHQGGNPRWPERKIYSREKYFLCKKEIFSREPNLLTRVSPVGPVDEDEVNWNPTEYK